MITFNVVETRYTTNPDGSPLRITLVLWNATKTYENIIGTIGPRGTVISPDYTPADIAYSTTTEADLDAWILDLEDEADIEAQLDTAITDLAVPQNGEGIPWQDSYDAWAINVNYVVGDIRIYKGLGYEVIEAHTSQALWTPPAAPTLWEDYAPPVPAPESIPSDWFQPTAETPQYPVDAIVLHAGHKWSSDVADNMLEPGVGQWTDMGVYP